MTPRRGTAHCFAMTSRTAAAHDAVTGMRRRGEMPSRDASPPWLDNKPSSEKTQEFTMSHSQVKLYTHIVFATQNRTPFLTDKAIRTEMHTFLASMSEAFDCPPLIINGTDDHIHWFMMLNQNTKLADVIQESKRRSSLWIKKRTTEFDSFYWQEGYGAFSVSVGNVARVRGYILRQEQHHRRISTIEEFQDIYKRNGIHFDPTEAFI